MAYKFQFGEARLSGSITQTNGTITALGLDNSNANATNFGDIDADSISVADAAVGLDIDGSGANTGLFTIKMGHNLASGLDIKSGSASYLKFQTTNGAENEMMIAGKSLKMDGESLLGLGGFGSSIGAVDSGESLQIDASTRIRLMQNSSTKAIVDANGLQVTGVVSGSGNLEIGGEITGSSINLGTAAGIAGDGIENDGGKLRVHLNGTTGISRAAGGISLSAVPDSSLAQISTAGKVALSALEIDGGTDVGAALADADLIIVDDNAAGVNRKATLSRLRTYMQDNLTLTDVDVNKTNLAARLAQYDGTETLNIGDADNDTSVVIRGNLTVNGSTTTVNSTTIEITSSLRFEGPADDHETTLTVGTPIQDISIVMPEFSSSLGAHGVKMAVLATGSTAAEYLAASKVTAAEFALLDGATSATSTTVADGDRVVFNDNGTMKQVTVQDLAAYFDDEITNMSGLVEAGALNAGSITSGFGAIDNGASGITTGGILKLDVDGTAINAAGALTMGAGNDAAMYFDGANLVLDTASGAKIAFEVAGTAVANIDADGISLEAGDAYQINNTSVLNATTLGGAVVNSSLTSVGALGAGSIASGFTKINVANMIDVASIDIDGATDIGEALVDADLLIVDNGADGTNRKVAMSRIATYVGGSSRLLPGGGTIITSATHTVDTELTLVNTTGNVVTLTMPDITDALLGKVFVIKDMGNNAQGNNIVINDSASGHLIDGAASVKIESNRGAINLVACKNGGTFFYSIF